MTLPSPQPKVLPYLTIIPDRKPVQKLHSNMGHAKNAIGGKFYGHGYGRGATCDMELHEWVQDKWEIRYSVKEGDKTAPWQVEALAKQAEKKEAEAVRRRQAAVLEARTQGNEFYNEQYPSNLSGTIAPDRSAFILGYIEGYMNARQEYGYGYD